MNMNGTMARAPANNRFSLEAITNRKPARVPLRIIINGIAGIGKTSLAAKFPAPIFIQSRGESGLQTLESAGLVSAAIVPFTHGEKTFQEAQDFQDVLDAIEWLTESQHDFKSLVIDVMNGVEKLLFEHVCRREFGGNWGEKGFASYGKGYEASMPFLKDLTIRLDRLRDEKGMTVIMLTHCKVKTFKNPLGSDYDKYVPDMHEKVWGHLFGWSDIVLFANRVVNVEVERNAKKGKADDTYRSIFTECGPAFDAKNRHNLPAEIPMGNSADECYTNFVNALKESKLQNASK